jgi:hypothetical protein
MVKIGMNDVVGIIRDGDVASLANNPDLLEYLSEVDELGTEILSQIPEDQIVASVTLLQALITTDLMSDGEMKMAFMCLSDVETFAGMMTIAMKISIGLAALEEWR